MRTTHLVLKLDDINKHLTAEEHDMLMQLTRKIDRGRKSEGKLVAPRYLLVNHDEPYARQVADIIGQHEGEYIRLEEVAT